MVYGVMFSLPAWVFLCLEIFFYFTYLLCCSLAWGVLFCFFTNQRWDSALGVIRREIGIWWVIIIITRLLLYSYLPYIWM